MQHTSKQFHICIMKKFRQHLGHKQPHNYITKLPNKIRLRATECRPTWTVYIILEYDQSDTCVGMGKQQWFIITVTRYVCLLLLFRPIQGKNARADSYKNVPELIRLASTESVNESATTSILLLQRQQLVSDISQTTVMLYTRRLCSITSIVSSQLDFLSV